MPQTADYLINGGTVITVTKTAALFGTAPLPFEETDRRRRKAEGLNREFTAGRVIDAKGKLIMPGFVNSHMHFYHTCTGGWLWKISGLAVVRQRSQKHRHGPHARG